MVLLRRGEGEQRRFFLAYLEETTEVLWSNGYGVRLGLSAWDAFRGALADGTVRPLPPLTHFGEVLDDTVRALGKVLASQRSQRQEAARKARGCEEKGDAAQAEDWRAAYTARLNAHRETLRDVARKAGWTFLVHHTDRPAAEPMLVLHSRLSGHLMQDGKGDGA